MTIHRALIWIEEIRDLDLVEKRLFLGPRFDPYAKIQATFHGDDARLIALLSRLRTQQPNPTNN